MENARPIPGVVYLRTFQELDPNPITPLLSAQHLYLGEGDTHYPQNWKYAFPRLTARASNKKPLNGVEVAEWLERTYQDEWAM